MDRSKIKSNLIIALLASLTLGLAPFYPEPHIIGKLRWIFGGAEGMTMMDFMDTLMHGLPWLALLYCSVQYLLITKKNSVNIQELVKSGNMQLIDVREPYEFNEGSIDGAVNMPLSKFANYTGDIKKMDCNKILFCRSGNRSGQAVKYLRDQGVDHVYNGGSVVILKSMMIPVS